MPPRHTHNDPYGDNPKGKLSLVVYRRRKMEEPSDKEAEDDHQHSKGENTKEKDRAHGRQNTAEALAAVVEADRLP